MIRVGYQGMEGSNSELAAEGLVNKLGLSDVEYVPLLTSEKVKKALVDGIIHYGVVATKNLNAGEVGETKEAFSGTKYLVKENYQLEIEHYLYTLKPKTEIKIIASHIQALMQCENTITELYPDAKLKDIEDTAIGAKYLREGILPEDTGVLCSKRAGEIFNLHLVKSNLQDKKSNITEFIIVELEEKKSVEIVGLGLIGGSMAKAFKKYTAFEVYGSDFVKHVENMALESKAIDKVGDEESIKNCDLLIVGLYPRKTVEYLQNVIPKMKKGALIVDLAGVKGSIVDSLENLAKENGIRFVGGHPMAGLAKGGFQRSFPELYKNANMILVPTIASCDEDIKYLSELFHNLGFGYIKICNREHHDKMIAHTSQLAHIVSNSYVKSVASDDTKGFCGGSYQDMTRVAPMNEILWKELFMLNRKALVNEIDEFLKNIHDVREILESGTEEELEEILKLGRLRKEFIDKNNTQGVMKK